MAEWQATLERLQFLWENMVLASSMDSSVTLPGMVDIAFVEAQQVVCEGFEPEAALEDPNWIANRLPAILSRCPSLRDGTRTMSNVQEAINLHRRWRRGMDDLARMMEDKERGWEHAALWTASIDRIVEDIFGNPVALGYLARDRGASINELSPAINDRMLTKIYEAFSSLDDHIDTCPSGLNKSKTPALTYQKKVLSRIAKTCDSLQRYCGGYEVPILLRYIPVLARCPFYANLLSFAELVEVFRCIRLLPETAKTVLRDWFIQCPLEILEQQVDLVRLMFTVCIMNDDIPQAHLADVVGPTVRHGISYLNIIHRANREREQRQLKEELTVQFYARKLPIKDLASDSLRPFEKNFLSAEEFHCDGINQFPIMLMTDFRDWTMNRGPTTTFGLMDHPFVLDAASKALLLSWDSAAQQRAESRRGAVNFGPLAFLSPYLILEVRRRNLVEDALNQLTKAQYGNRRLNSFRLKKPLKVVFKGEEGVDEGGVAKEFFQLLVEQLFNPDYGMFAYYPETRYFWFKRDSFEAFVQFELIGIVLGLALYNNIILDIHFPPVVYKKLLSGSSYTSPPPLPTAGSPPNVNPPTNPPSAAGSMTTPAAQPPLVIRDHFTATIRRPLGSMSSAAEPSRNLGGSTAGPTEEALQPRTFDGSLPPPEGSTGTTRGEGTEMTAGAPSQGWADFLGVLLRQIGGSGSERSTGTETETGGESRTVGLNAVSDLSAGSGGEPADQDIVAVMARSLPPYQPCLEDLEDFEPQLVKSMRQLLMAPPDSVESMCLAFSVDVEQFGVINSIPLPREGRTGPPPDDPEDVTVENREEYVRALLQYHLVESIKPQFDAFYRGFHRCCGGHVLRLFDPTDLNLVICGCPGDLNFEELEKCVEYADGYNAQNPVIRMFWEVVHELDQESKKKLLFFITGSDRTPVKGLSSMKMVIGRAGGEKNRLPTAHTCFNYLLLPEYDSKEKLRHYLKIALENRHGFGLR